MPNKSQPKPMAGYSVRWVPKDETQRIEAAISVFAQHNIILTDEHKQRLQSAAKFYYWDIHRRADQPTLSECRNALQKLMEAAQRFEEALANLDKRTYELLRTDRTSWEIRIRDKESASYWWWAARVALHEIKDKRDGRKPDQALHSLLFNIAEVYESAVGKKPRLSRREGATPTGPFFRLVKDLLVSLQIFLPDCDGKTNLHDEPIYHAAKQALKIRTSQKMT